MTPLTIFGTSPPPPPKQSEYLVPASSLDGAALDFRLSFAVSKIRKMKLTRFKEELGIFKLAYERPFLAFYKKMLEEKWGKTKSERKALKEKRKQELLPGRHHKKTLFELERTRQRQMYLTYLRYPDLAPSPVTAEDLEKFYTFLDTRPKKEIHDHLYAEIFNKSGLTVVPHKYGGYLYSEDFDPENPDEFPSSEEMYPMHRVFTSFSKTDEEISADLDDELEGLREREERLTKWEKDPRRFKGKWIPRSWPPQELELSRIKNEARTLNYLREQLQKHGLLSSDEARLEALQSSTKAEGKTESSGVTSSSDILSIFSESTLEDSLVPTNVDGPKQMEKKPSLLYSVNSEEGMERARKRVARLNRHKEHVEVPLDDSPKKQIFTDGPLPGIPAVEFIYRYTMDPDAVMGSLNRLKFIQRKVVMKVHIPSLKLTPPAQQRLIALVGKRYDARSGWLKLVGDKHPNRHLNHRYVTLLMKELLQESFLADPRYAPLSDLKIDNPSSLRRQYTLPDELLELWGDKPSRKEHGWDYKMFKFAPGFLGPQQLEREATLLKQRLTSALV